MGKEGARILSEALDYIHITSLRLHGNIIEDEGIGKLLLAEDSIYLVNLFPVGNEIECGFQTVPRLLDMDGTLLESLLI